MLYRFLLLSDEVDSFKREIKISSEASFLEFQDAILDSVNYTKDQMTSFFICNDDWSKGTEISLIEMDTSYEVDNYVMEDTTLSQLVDEEGQKLLFVFEYISERAFFMELREIVIGNKQTKALCSLSLNNPPAQISSENYFDNSPTTSSTLEENFYGDEEFDMDELDKEGFDGLDEISSGEYEESL
ncbi:hypothetical protein AwDysgo_06920 [Bacteroidales bacterium]|nr:hypothetical protein AwDysgo_06920 [Bacteroidales bacterium]